MKQLANHKANVQLFEKFVRAMSKGYYSTFSEYNPDHLESDESDDNSQVDEENDHFNIFGNGKQNDSK